MEITEIYCHATVFSQIFRQIDVLPKNFAINWFDGKKFAWQWIFDFSTLHCAHSMEKWKIHFHDWKKISWNQQFSNSSTFTISLRRMLKISIMQRFYVLIMNLPVLIWQNIFTVRVIFFILPQSTLCTPYIWYSIDITKFFSIKQDWICFYFPHESF